MRSVNNSFVLGLLCLFSMVIASCTNKPTVNQKDVVGNWSSSADTNAHLSLNPDHTFALTGLPSSVFNGSGDISKKTLSMQGSWTISHHANSDGVEAYIGLHFKGSQQIQPQATLSVADNGSVCFFVVGDPDEKIAYEFRKAASQQSKPMHPH